MPEICDLNELPAADVITPEYVQAMIRRIDVTIMNLISGAGSMTAVDVREGDHESKPTNTLAELRRMRQMFSEVLNDPVQMNDLKIILSEWDNPDLPVLRDI